ncbi:NAD(P)/FAD-dependent oxidoreductase [Rivibacter subsaxonicus]|uniref:L-2-hydroxyglutarate oxidase LhgO n=1 Tax=Rivibacter subsaxonicus TaxID=457575 RepID=A0A4Q7VMX7_9BURK|nr:NAD(P)/FAD-dependent oxidoreductase [Rivibacter subsaxonicus]RZT97690.1 L-2-hydroxyglutarate oxidase LhgO [Rivibacter subsaxonicus]
MDRVDAVVIGAGVVGLAVARALALSGRETLVLEQESAIGTGVSARNSEVIHAGLYYPTGSLRARLCVAGRDRLYAYCTERGVGHRRSGKLVVAIDARQRVELAALQARAAANGVPGLQWLEREQLRMLEPVLEAEAGFLSPATGIVDSHALMLALQGDLETAGGMVAVASKVHRIDAARGPGGAHVLLSGDSELAAAVVVNAAGLGAIGLAGRVSGSPPAPGYAAPVEPTRFAKGNYFSLALRSPFSRLIYPLPEPGGLGVHLTLDLGGRARFGPDVEWIERGPDGGFDYRVDPARAPAFEAAVRRWWPGLPAGVLQPDYSGVRPKLVGPGEPAPDFRIDGPAAHGWPGLVHLLGIESPGLTASLALADEVLSML